MSALSDKMSRIHLLTPLTMAAIGGVVVAAAVLMWRTQTAGDSMPKSDVSAGQVIAQSMALNASAAVNGDNSAFEALSNDRQRALAWFNENGKAENGKTLADSTSAKQLLATSQRVLDGHSASQAAHVVAKSAANIVPQLLQGLVTVVSGLGSARVESMTLPLKRFENSGQSLMLDLQALALGVGDVKDHGLGAAESLEYMSQVLGELRGDPSGLGLPRVTSSEGDQKLQALTALYRQLADKVKPVLNSVEQLAAVNEASRETLVAQQAFINDLLHDQTNTHRNSAPIPVLELIALGAVVAILFMLLSLATTARSVGREARKQGDQNERNQQAILRLLDELSNLADGDLTVQATVSEDITGAIADSINYAIEALRELVATINSTAITLDASAKQTLASAGHLAKASVAQSKQVAAASESAAAVAGSVEEVSGNAERSSDVARHAVDIAHKGGEAVRRTIAGMNTIRETIQETSKRIKRLGESSQEIGNIVELINDIAEQTNILALNASIQASMAGEAGRGFAVVADEVQRLAERAANATRQIEGLVRTIQADTNEAVVSMERSTTDVVGGALLAENAGSALVEIEQVSNQIASLVQNISASARQQTSTTQNIARNMQVLREISSQTAENSAATSTSVGKLAQLSTQLRKSVAGFRLQDKTTLPPIEVAVERAPAAKVDAKADPKSAPRQVGRLSA